MRSPVDPKLTERILAEFLIDRREPGDLFWSEHEIAERFGVKRYAARTAVLRLVQRGVLRREQGRGTFLSDSIDVTPGLLNSHRIHLAFIAPTWGHDEKFGGFIAELTAGLTTCARQTNAALTLFSEPGCLDNPLFPARLKMSNCNVLLVADPPIEAFVGLTEIRRTGFPVIALAFPQAVFERLKIPVIHSGDREGMNLLVKRLCSEGKRRIRVIGTLKRPGYHERYLGFRDAMEELEHRVPSGVFINSGEDDSDIATLRDDLMSDAVPQALIFQQHVTFLKSWNSLPQLKAAVNDGLEVIVFDAVHLEHQLPGIPITRIVQNPVQIAGKVMDLAQNLIREMPVPPNIRIQNLVLRPERAASKTSNSTA